MKWISVKDRLPEEDGWVLVYEDGAMNCAMFHGKRFYDATYANCYNIIVEKITHWTPLPKPPKT